DRPASGKVRFANLHGSRTEAVAGEHACHAGAFGQLEDGEIASVGLADAGFGNADFNAGYGENVGLGGDLQVNGHDSVSVAGQINRAWAGGSFVLSHPAAPCGHAAPA